MHQQNKYFYLITVDDGRFTDTQSEESFSSTYWDANTSIMGEVDALVWVEIVLIELDETQYFSKTICLRCNPRVSSKQITNTYIDCIIL